MPNACRVIQNIPLFQCHFSVVKLLLVLLANIDALVCLMHFILHFKVSSIFEVRCVTNNRSFHTRLNTKSPLFATFNLNSEVFLKVHVPISIITFPRQEGLNFTSGVTGLIVSSCAWEVATKTVAHLVQQLLTPL